MKNLFYLFLPIIGLWIVSSCSDDFLGETEITDLDRETVFADSTYTAGFLTQIYVDIGFDTNPNRYGGEHGGLQTSCDEAEFKETASIATDILFATGTVNPVAVSEDDVWRITYRNIRRVNVFLKYVEGTPMAITTKTKYKAEARFLRAWYYAMLLRHYGGIPLIGDTVYESTDEIKTTRDTYADCVEYIINECKEAEKDLPDIRIGFDHGRISGAACKALVSRVRLYAASKLFNGSDFAPSEYPKELLGYPEYDQERWKLAVDAALDVMKMNKFTLYSRHWDDENKEEPGWGFYAIFQAKDFVKLKDGTDGKMYDLGAYCETILERKAEDGFGFQKWYAPPTTGGDGVGGYIYHGLAELFPMKDGKSITESAFPYDPLEPNVNRDPRFGNTVTYDGCKMISNRVVGSIYIYKGIGATKDAIYQGTPTGYYTRKSVHRKISANTFPAGPQSRPLIRYAEILLNYAEAVNEYYGPTHEDVLGDNKISPYEVLKLIRERAGIEAGEDGMYGLKENMDRNEMSEAIRLERRLELAFEGHRFFDVRRWMIVEDTDNKMMQGYEITKDVNGVRTGRVIDVRRHIFRKAMYFYPIPYKETVKSKKLLQNPYYE